MGKWSVLYWVAALVLGCLMVVIPMAIGLSTYVLLTEPKEISSEAFLPAIFTGFAIYLVTLWATQESFEEKFGLLPRMIVFIASPVAVMYFHAEWSLMACMGALAFIASLAVYQALVTRFARTAVLS